MAFARDQAQNWLIMKNDDRAIPDIFHGNILTFNPGWNSDADPLEQFTDVRQLLREFKARGVTMAIDEDEPTSGPAGFMVVDPDGSRIPVDQHVQAKGALVWPLLRVSPVNANQGESSRIVRICRMGHTPGRLKPPATIHAMESRGFRSTWILGSLLRVEDDASGLLGITRG